jgi:DNA-binding response OmpR family regulator
MSAKKQLKILMLEDNHDDVWLIERVLRKDGFVFESFSVDIREEFNKAILEFKPDVILSDHGLPQFNSIQALKLCQQENYVVPFILVTGTVSDEFAMKCIEQGADDYILKSDLSKLPTAIRNAIQNRASKKSE